MQGVFVSSPVFVQRTLPFCFVQFLAGLSFSLACKVCQGVVLGLFCFGLLLLLLRFLLRLLLRLVVVEVFQLLLAQCQVVS